MSAPDLKRNLEYSSALLVTISVTSLVAGILIGGGKLPWPAGLRSSEPQAATANAHDITTAVRLIAVSDKGAFIDVAHQDAECVRRDALTGRNLHRIRVPRGKLPWLQFSGAGSSWAGINRKNELEILRDEVRLWHGCLPDQRPDEALLRCQLCKSRGLVSVISNLGSLWLLDCTGERAEIQRHQIEGAPFSDISLAPLGDQIVLITELRKILIWDTAEHRVIHRLEAIEPTTRFATWSGDGRRLITFGESRELDVWDVATGTRTTRLAVDHQVVFTAELSFDGRKAAVGDSDEIRLWDLDTGEELPSLAGHRGMITSLTFADQGETLFSGDSLGRVCRWSLADSREVWAAP